MIQLIGPAGVLSGDFRIVGDARCVVLAPGEDIERINDRRIGRICSRRRNKAVVGLHKLFFGIGDDAGRTPPLLIVTLTTDMVQILPARPDVADVEPRIERHGQLFA